VLALQRSDLTVRYVAEHITTNLPPLYRVAALFAGTAGRSLSFALFLGACAAAATTPASRAPRRWGLTALAVVVFGALLWSALGAPPFARVPWQLTDGRGLDPKLQNPLLFTQQPLMLLGYALLLTAAALALDAKRRATLSVWLFAAWLCELAAVVLGGPLPLSLMAILAATLALVLPSIRRQWWPGTRAGPYALSAVIALAFMLGLLANMGPREGINISLGQGESSTLRDAFENEWTLTQQGVSAFRSENHEVTAVTIEAASGAAVRALLVSERRQAVDSRGEEIGSVVVVPARHRGLMQEIAVRLERIHPDNSAELRVDFQAFKSARSTAYLLLLATGIALCVGAVRRTA
jgi:hypothetical protein